MKTKILPLFIAVLMAAIAAFGFWKFDRSRQQMFRTWYRLRVFQKASPIRSALEAGINRRMQSAEILASIVGANPNLKAKEFESFARTLAAGDTTVRSFILARRFVVDAVFPLAGNEKALGFEILKAPEQRRAAERAVSIRGAVLAGPVKLAEGGTAFICRVPVYGISPKTSEKDTTALGLANVLIKPDALFREAGLSTFYGSLRLALRGKDGLGAKGGVFFGDDRLFRSGSVLLDVRFPNGSWQLAALPAGGWAKTAPGSVKFRIFGAAMILMTGILFYPFSKNLLRLV